MLTLSLTPETLPQHLTTVAEFDEWQRLNVKEGNYEFVRGHIIPKPATKQDEFFIANFLLRRFSQTNTYV